MLRRVFGRKNVTKVSGVEKLPQSKEVVVIRPMPQKQDQKMPQNIPVASSLDKQSQKPWLSTHDQDPEDKLMSRIYGKKNKKKVKKVKSRNGSITSGYETDASIHSKHASKSRKEDINHNQAKKSILQKDRRESLASKSEVTFNDVNSVRSYMPVRPNQRAFQSPYMADKHMLTGQMSPSILLRNTPVQAK